MAILTSSSMPDLEDGEIEEGELPDTTLDAPQKTDVRLSVCSYTIFCLVAGLRLATSSLLKVVKAM